MNTIIIEGCDNSGKSTLARHVSQQLGMMNIQESEGPPQSREEINNRIRRYRTMSDTIFVRHPVISEAMYSLTRDPVVDLIEPQLKEEFYNTPSTIVYCDPLDRGLAGHIIKPHDSDLHIERMTTKYVTLIGAYRAWAYRKAHLIYRIGDDMERVIAMLRTQIC